MNNVADNNQQIQKDDSQELGFLQQDLAQSRKIQDSRREAQLLIKLGSNYYSSSNYDQALECYQQSLNTAQKIPDRRLEALAMFGLGWVYQIIEANGGKYEQMLECHHQCLAIAEEISDLWLLASVQVSLGRTYQILGNNDKAISYSQQGLDIARQINALSLEEGVSETLKMVNEALGTQQQNIENQDILPSGELVLSQIGLVPTSLKLRQISPQLRAQYRAVINWLTKYKPPQDVSNLKKVRGYLETCHHLFAVAAWKEAITVFSTRLNPPFARELHLQLSLWGYYREKIELYSQLLGKLDSSTDATSLNNLGGAYCSLGDYDKAIECHQKSLAIARE